MEGYCYDVISLYFYRFEIATVRDWTIQATTYHADLPLYNTLRITIPCGLPILSTRRIDQIKFVTGGCFVYTLCQISVTS